MRTCTHCRKNFNADHHCCVTHTVVYYNDDSSFLTSLLIAEATDSAMLGMMGGGDIMGAIIGQEIADSFIDNNSSCDVGGFDSNSCDSGWSSDS